MQAVTRLPQRLLPAAEWAALAYEDWGTNKESLASQGFSVVHPFDSQGTQAYIARRDGLVVYSFAGTNEWIDWLRDLQAQPKSWPKTWITAAHLGSRGVTPVWFPSQKLRVHSGFFAALLPVVSEMWTKLREVYRPGDMVIGTHHSLGAGPGSYFGALFAARLPELSPDRHELYLWGSPRLGNAYWRDMLNRTVPRTLRIVNNNDLVPRVPPAVLGYRHTGRLLYLDWRARPWLSAGLFRRGWNQIVGRVAALWNDDFFDGITDHLMDRGYLPAVRHAVKITTAQEA